MPSCSLAPRVPSDTNIPTASSGPPPATAQAPSHQHPCFPAPVPAAATATSSPSPAPHPSRSIPHPGADPTAQYDLQPSTQGLQGQGEASKAAAAAAWPRQVSLFAAAASASSAEGEEAPHRWEAAEVDEYSSEYQMWLDAERASALAATAAAASSPTAGGGERSSTGGGERSSAGGRGSLLSAAVMRLGSLSQGGSISMDGRASGSGFGVESQGGVMVASHRGSSAYICRSALMSETCLSNIMWACRVCSRQAGDHWEELQAMSKRGRCF